MNGSATGGGLISGDTFASVVQAAHNRYWWFCRHNGENPNDGTVVVTADLSNLFLDATQQS